MSIETALEVLREYASECDLRWDEPVAEGFATLLRMVAQAPGRLVANAEPMVLARDHCIDSLELLRQGITLHGKNVLDLGSGGGFPGLPLALMAEPECITLLDSRAKATAFLREACVEIFPEGQEHVQVLHMRAEAAAHEPTHRATYDVVVTRAVAAMPVLLELACGFLKPKGCLVAYKGPMEETERAQAEDAARTLGLAHQETICYTLWQDERMRSLAIYRQEVPAPAGYPRPTGRPGKRPL